GPAAAVAGPRSFTNSTAAKKEKNPMKLWSRGLGSTEITMDFRHYTVTKDKETGNILIVGNMQDPVNWEFRVTMEPDDIPGFMKILFNISVLVLGIKNAHRYLSYLLHRKDFAAESDNERLEKVNKAYEAMMRRSRAGKR
ncbi:MAG: hypothetical protein QMD09_09960, partial [Desulfatibacillaceae bacterium]|nr:hypothetical protein [Desulfatibacillaceae bacterium]